MRFDPAVRSVRAKVSTPSLMTVTTAPYHTVMSGGCERPCPDHRSRITDRRCSIDVDAHRILSPLAGQDHATRALGHRSTPGRRHGASGSPPGTADRQPSTAAGHRFRRRLGIGAGRYQKPRARWPDATSSHPAIRHCRRPARSLRSSPTSGLEHSRRTAHPVPVRIRNASNRQYSLLRIGGPSAFRTSARSAMPTSIAVVCSVSSTLLRLSGIPKHPPSASPASAPTTTARFLSMTEPPDHRFRIDPEPRTTHGHPELPQAHATRPCSVHRAASPARDARCTASGRPLWRSAGHAR